MQGCRIYPAVTDSMRDRDDLSFDQYFIDTVESILTDDLHEKLCAERYKVLLESLLCDDNVDMYTIIDSMRADRAERYDNTYNMAIDRFLTPDRRTRETFKSLILCYAAQGIIPITQSVLGAAVQEFLNRAGAWETSTRKYKDAMRHRLPGSFENGKRR